MEIMIFPVFVARLGCGYYVRDKIPNKQHGVIFIVNLRSKKRQATPSRIQDTTHARLWSALRNLLPLNEQKPAASS
jgi:hypothetical protein